MKPCGFRYDTVDFDGENTPDVVQEGSSQIGLVTIAPNHDSGLNGGGASYTGM
jgi:hypothetical protein